MALKIYKLIVFKEETQRKIRSIDFVPANWISYDIELEDLVTQFMPPPYSKENLTLLHDLVKGKAPPPESWPKYRVDIIGEARTYDTAVEKLKILEKERFAFSTDSEEHAAEKARVVKKLYQLKQTPNHAKETEILAEVPDLDDEVNFSDTESEPIGAGSNGIEKSCKASDASKQAAKCTSPAISTEKIISSGSEKSLPSTQASGTSEQVAKHTNPHEQNSEEDDLSKAYRSHSIQITKIQTTLDKIKSMLQDLGKGIKHPITGHPINEKTFAETQDITLPFQTLIEFEDFETKLGSDQNVCTQLKRDMWYLIEPKSDLTRSVSNIIKKYMTRAVVINFAAVKKCAGKEVLSSTVFCRCMKGRPLSDEIKLKVTQFYEDDQVSVALPGMKDFISVRDDDGQKVHYQKKLILCNLKELYEQFKVDNPEIRIGFSMFASLRPRHCTLAGASGTHTVCVCPLHQNMKLMISACNLKKLTENSTISLESYEDCLSMLMCAIPDSPCHLSRCPNCPGYQPLKEILSEVLDENDIEEVTFTQWVLKPRATLETYVKCTDEFIDQFCERAKSLLQHSFIAKQQSIFLKSLKENLSDGDFIVIMDFAENYAFVTQNAAPSFHWNNDQATVYPVVIYYTVNGVITHKSLVGISNCLNHDSVTVYVFTRMVIDFIKSEIGMPKRIFYFSDGAPQQFKNYKNFINLWYHKQDFAIPAEWHFFATAHGKGPCDGIGGTLKRMASRASLQLPSERQILHPRALFEWSCLPGTLPAIAKRFCSVHEYNIAKASLAVRFEGAKAIPNTQKQHCFIPFRDGNMITKLYSSSPLSEVDKIFKKKN